MSSAAANKQYLDIQRDQIRIIDTLNLLRRFYRECNKEYARVLTTDYLKEKSLPHQITAVIQDKGIVRVKGAGAGKTFLWATTPPTEEMAEQCWREAVRIRSEYEVTKARERRGESPNRVQVGHKQFIRLVNPTPNTPISVLKKIPGTVTEVNVLKKLKVIKTLLTTGQSAMDFASLCLHHGISTKWEKAFLKTVVGRTHKGFEWIASDDIDYEMVRNVIDVSKTITETELDIPTPIIKPSQEIKSEFEKVLETKTAEIKNEILPEIKSKKEDDENSRSNQRLFRLFSLLQELHKILNYEVVRSISSFCRKHNIPESMVKVMKDSKIITKTELGYNWIGPVPSKTLTEELNDSYNKKYNVYTPKKVVTNEIGDKVIFTKNKKEMSPQQMGNILVNFLTDQKDEKKKQIMKLAEKFTKAGNYEMAEQLLDQVI